MPEQEEEQLKPLQLSLKSNNYIGIANNAMRTLPPLAVHADDLYQWTGKFWDTLTDMDIGQHIFTLFAGHYPKGWSPSKTKSIIEAVKYHPSITKVIEFDNYKDRNIMNLENGVLDLDHTGKGLIPHDKKYMFTSCIPIPYDQKNTECPHFKEFLQDVFRNPDDTIDTNMCDTIIQLGGYLIYPKVRAKKLFIFYGNGSNGKSIIMDYVFSMFFNENNVTDLSMDILANEDNTARGDLQTSRLNMCGEQAGIKIKFDEIKKIVSGEWISTKRHYKNGRKRFKPHTKVLISGNKRIVVMDSSYGADRRLFPMDFLNKFVSAQEYADYEVEYAKLEQTPNEKRIFLAKDELVLAQHFKDEAPAILNLFLDGLKALAQNQWKFKKHQSIIKAEMEYKTESDPTTLWIKKTYIESKDPNDFIPIQQIYDIDYMVFYNLNFSHSKRSSPLRKNTLAKKIRDEFRIDTISKSNIKGFRLKNL